VDVVDDTFQGAELTADHSHVTEQREDVSRFVIHLTRDDRGDFTHGASARKNFLRILKEQKIIGFRPHCLHSAKLKMLSADLRKSFCVACFTEVPLSQVRHLIGSIEGRQIELSSYGFVFTKKYLIEKGAQPAIYINSYDGNMHLREAVDTIFEKAQEGNFKGKIWRLLPFINAMHERYDFTWEREWRVRGTFTFSINKLVCAILPPDGNDDVREALATAGIAAISPTWTYERIVAELALQQRKTRVIIKGLASATARGEKVAKDVTES